MAEQLIAPDFWIVALDETEYWSDEIKAVVESVYGLYLYDTKRVVHAASLQGSYELWSIGVDVEFKEGLTDEEREVWRGIIDEGWYQVSQEMAYYAAPGIDSVSSDYKVRIGDAGLTGELGVEYDDYDDYEELYEEKIEELLDYYQGDPPSLSLAPEDED